MEDKVEPIIAKPRARKALPFNVDLASVSSFDVRSHGRLEDTRRGVGSSLDI
jgi:hypothetical protein